MFCNEKSKVTLRSQNSTVYELQSIQLSTTFKYEHGGKVNTHTHTPLVTHKTTNRLQRQFNKVGIKRFGNV